MCNCTIIPGWLHSTTANKGVIDKDFRPHELLFHRVPPEIDLLDEAGRRNIGIVDKTHNISCHWSKHCQGAADSLYDDENCQHLADWNVISWEVATIEMGFNVSTDENPYISYSVSPSHDPTDCMYCHCEIHAFLRDQKLIDQEEKENPDLDPLIGHRQGAIPPSLKTAYRTFLADICTIQISK